LAQLKSGLTLYFSRAGLIGLDVVSGLIGFCVGDGQTPPKPRTTERSPLEVEREQKEQAARKREESDKQLAEMYHYDPDSGLDLSAWCFSYTLAESKIKREVITDEGSKRRVFEEATTRMKQTMERMREPSKEREEL